MPHRITIGGRTFQIELVDPQTFRGEGGDSRQFRWDLDTGVIQVADPGDPFLRNRRIHAAVAALQEHLESDQTSD